MEINRRFVLWDEMRDEREERGEERWEGRAGWGSGGALSKGRGKHMLSKNWTQKKIKKVQIKTQQE